MGYGVLGDVLTQGAPPQAPDLCLAVFGGHGADLRPDAGGLRQNRGAVSGVPPGSAPGVVCRRRGCRLLRRPVAEPGPLAHGGDRLKASFCIYLTHLFFLDFLAGRGPLRRDAPPVWGVPVLVAAAFGAAFWCGWSSGGCRW